MKENIERTVNATTLLLQQSGQLHDRCGLCCVLLPTRSFSKGGVVCQNLKLENGLFACSVYPNRHETCRRFTCDRVVMNERLEWFILDALSGKKRVIYYHEDLGYGEEEDYAEDEDILKSIKDMKRLGLLNHSFIYRALQSDNRITRQTLPALWALLQSPNLKALEDDPLIEILGINAFLQRLSIRELDGTVVKSNLAYLF